MLALQAPLCCKTSAPPALDPPKAPPEAPAALNTLRALAYVSLPKGFEHHQENRSWKGNHRELKIIPARSGNHQPCANQQSLFPAYGRWLRYPGSAERARLLEPARGKR